MSIRHTIRAILVLGCGAVLAAQTAHTALAAQPADKLTLVFTDAEHYADIGRGNIDRSRNIKTLSDYLQGLAKQLPDDQQLSLEVLDVDLAGELLFHGAQELRVLRGGADWPRIQLRYTLTRDGRTLKSGEAQISDLAYLYTLRGRAEFYGDLAYEKHMLQGWFQKTLLVP